jgi:protein phosphatase
VVAEPGYGIFVVADGMGGRPGGGQASRVAARTFMETLRRVNPSVLAEPNVLRKAVSAANAAVLAIGSGEPNMKGMGTTLTAAILSDGGNRIVHVGDSRMYHFAKGLLTQLTEDHTLASELVAREYMTKEAAAKFPMRDVLSRAVGTQTTVEPDIDNLAVRPGEWLVLATDGLTKTVPKLRLAEIMVANEKAGAPAVCRAIIKAAMDAGPRDNVTVAVVRLVG